MLSPLWILQGGSLVVTAYSRSKIACDLGCKFISFWPQLQTTVHAGQARLTAALPAVAPGYYHHHHHHRLRQPIATTPTNRRATPVTTATTNSALRTAGTAGPPFDGTAHLVEAQDLCRAAFVRRQQVTVELDPLLSTPASHTTGTSTRLGQHVNPSLLATSPTPISRPREAQPLKQDSESPKKFVSDEDKIVLEWSPHDANLESFKSLEIKRLDNDNLARFVRDQDKEGKIYWNAIIPFKRTFAASQKKRLDSSKLFKQFLLIGEGASEDRKIVVRLGQKDPKVTAEKESVYKHLKSIHTGSSSAGTPSDSPSKGARAAASLSDLVIQLKIIHKPSSEHSGSHKIGVFINPSQLPGTQWEVIMSKELRTQGSPPAAKACGCDGPENAQKGGGTKERSRRKAYAAAGTTSPAGRDQELGTVGQRNLSERNNTRQGFNLNRQQRSNLRTAGKKSEKRIPSPHNPYSSNSSSSEITGISGYSRRLKGIYPSGRLDENPDEYFTLTRHKQLAGLKLFGVTLKCPPKSNLFQFKKKAPRVPKIVPNTPAIPAISATSPAAFQPLSMMNLMFNPMNMMSMMNMMGMPTNGLSLGLTQKKETRLGLIPTNTTSSESKGSGSSLNQPRSQPSHPNTPMDEGTLADFLRFAHVDPDSTAVNDGMRSLGITHWSMFQLFQARKLHEAGIPEGPAQSLVNFAQKYPDHLRRHRGT
ncbi:hypothetical protein PTTG_26076 [Puccinia triticina 1-1 BBBD Race 1]|uniref:Uncharacterized protein n=1 Tax=Puccinia triticina (isolate 1-1 / race 1 (BBBD)) TaxID=630390 RepID=A0A180GWM1_PUCT1|nr:hypothetical protein PTTG_26076 [Puccinia triticina 1-1 BBBD Race 1]